MDKLLPCAHCGSQDIGGSFSDNMYCYQCGASAPGLDAWNTRHTPEGWRLVPEWLTHKMSLAGRDACGEDSDYISAYEAMLAAAPKWGGE